MTRKLVIHCCGLAHTHPPALTMPCAHLFCADGLNDEYLLDPANYAFAQHSFSLLQMITQQAERPALSLEESVQTLLEPADTVETMEACISFFHSATMWVQRCHVARAGFPVCCLAQAASWQGLLHLRACMVVLHCGGGWKLPSPHVAL